MQRNVFSTEHDDFRRMVRQFVAKHLDETARTQIARQMPERQNELGIDRERFSGNSRGRSPLAADAIGGRMSPSFRFARIKHTSQLRHDRLHIKSLHKKTDLLIIIEHGVSYRSLVPKRTALRNHRYPPFNEEGKNAVLRMNKP